MERPSEPGPPCEPYEAGVLDVGDGHRIAWERCGTPGGIPAVALHGGPGAGISPAHRRLFDPARFDVVLFDQRGCGRSTPHGSLRSNTTEHLVADLERLRLRFGIARWLLVGGSWGSTLALAYAQRHPERVAGLVLSAVWTARRRELRRLYGDGAARLAPDAWARFTGLVPRGADVLTTYRALLASPHRSVQILAARTWCAWERALADRPNRSPRPLTGAEMAGDEEVTARAAIGVHYAAHGFFLDEGELLANADRLSGIPGAIVQGRRDAVAPAGTAVALHHAWPGSILRFLPDMGHALDAPALRAAIEGLQAFPPETGPGKRPERLMPRASARGSPDRLVRSGLGEPG